MSIRVSGATRKVRSATFTEFVPTWVSVPLILRSPPSAQATVPREAASGPRRKSAERIPTHRDFIQHEVLPFGEMRFVVRVLGSPDHEGGFSLRGNDRIPQVFGLPHVGEAFEVAERPLHRDSFANDKPDRIALRPAVHLLGHE